MTDPILRGVEGDRRNYLYMRRKEQLLRLVLDGDYKTLRRLLDYIDPQPLEAPK